MPHHTATPPKARRALIQQVALVAALCALAWPTADASALGRPRDRDGDGIIDSLDKCPDAPENFNGFEDEDGCPDDRDTDGDGIPDSRDLCPTLPEDFDGDKDDDGCPDHNDDADGDGIPDALDKCPFNPEDHDGFQDDDGCPDPDNDGDGIADPLDLCPDVPENFNGVEDDDGCPELEAVVTEKKIELSDKIYFAHNSAVLLPVSYPILDAVLRVFEDNPALHVRIEGHTDDQGSDEFNLKLSDGRAQTVARYLIARGVEPKRIVAVGFGERQPIAENTTESGRAQNRRVEFFILKR
jgi:outer membrane protein OmpA-like peptidoglycan-associated protein